uniref:SET domain-containing protein n=1 Tax=Angiostrongylus cantonensis TaxID=6313 RepID=A0A0K0DDK7_ANGCA
MDFSSADVNKLKGEFLQTAADLFESVLSKPPTHNIVDLWKEHQHIRKTLEEISTKQALLGDTDVRLLKPRDVPEKQCCLTVPRHAIISTDLAKKVKSDSKWTSYLNVLPNVYTTPLFYTEEELRVVPSFQNQKARTQPPLMYSSPFTVVNFTFSLYRWSVGTVTTRINLIPCETTRADGAVDMVPALIPMLDMANHEVVLGSDDLGDAVSMFYGRRSCAEHLLHNGFVPPDNNPFDSYKLKISLGRSDKMFKEKQKLFVEMGFSESSNVYMHDIILGPQPFHPSLEHFARVYVADNPEVHLINTVKCSYPMEASKPATLRKAVDFLKNRFAILERAYGTIAEGRTSNEINMARLKKAEVAILKNAR